MSQAQIQNAGWYVAIAFGAAILATGLQLGVVLSGTDPIEWRPLASVFVNTLFASLATAAGTAFRPRAGREELSGLVKEVGVAAATTALEVEAVKQATGLPDRLSDDEIERLAKRVLDIKSEAAHG